MAKRFDFYLSEMRDREAAKLFLQKARANTDHHSTFSRETDCGVTQRPFVSSQPKVVCRSNALNEHATTAITVSNPITAASSGGRVPCRDLGRSDHMGCD